MNLPNALSPNPGSHRVKSTYPILTNPMSDPSQKILVTGGAGFIASHLCEALLADGAELVVIDDFNDFYDPAIKRANIAGFRKIANAMLAQGVV